MVIIPKLSKTNRISYSSLVLQSVLLFTYTLLLSKLYGLSAVAAIALTKSFGAVMIGLLTAKTSETIVKFCTGSGEQSKEKIVRYYTVGTLLDSVMVLLMLLAIPLMKYIMINYLSLNPYYSRIATYTLITISVNALTPIDNGVFQILNKPYLVHLTRCILPSLNIVILIVLSAGSKSLDELDLVVRYQLYASIIYVTVLKILIYRTIMPTEIKMRLLEKSEVNEYITFIKVTFFSSVAKNLNQNIDNIGISYVAGEATLGLYVIAKQFLIPVTKVTDPFSINMYKNLMHVFIVEKKLGILLYLRKILKKVSILTLIVSVACSIISFFYLCWASTEEIVTIALVVLMATIDQFFKSTMWWCRIYSQIVDPTLGMRANYTSLILSLGNIVLHRVMNQGDSFLIGQALIAAGFALFWHFELRKN